MGRVGASGRKRHILTLLRNVGWGFGTAALPRRPPGLPVGGSSLREKKAIRKSADVEPKGPKAPKPEPKSKEELSELYKQLGGDEHQLDTKIQQVQTKQGYAAAPLDDLRTGAAGDTPATVHCLDSHQILSALRREN
jgi:hypothetical protein